MSDSGTLKPPPRKKNPFILKMIDEYNWREESKTTVTDYVWLPN